MRKSVLVLVILMIGSLSYGEEGASNELLSKERCLDIKKIYDDIPEHPNVREHSNAVGWRQLFYEGGCSEITGQHLASKKSAPLLNFKAYELRKDVPLYESLSTDKWPPKGVYFHGSSKQLVRKPLTCADKKANVEYTIKRSSDSDQLSLAVESYNTSKCSNIAGALCVNSHSREIDRACQAKLQGLQADAVSFGVQ